MQKKIFLNKNKIKKIVKNALSYALNISRIEG